MFSSKMIFPFSYFSLLNVYAITYLNGYGLQKWYNNIREIKRDSWSNSLKRGKMENYILPNNETLSVSWMYLYGHVAKCIEGDTFGRVQIRWSLMKTLHSGVESYPYILKSTTQILWKEIRRGRIFGENRGGRIFGKEYINH